MRNVQTCPVCPAESCDAPHSERRFEFVSIPHRAATEPPATVRKQMKMGNIRELSAAELGAVSGGSPTSPVSVPAHMFDKLFAGIDKNLETVKQLKPGGYFPPT